MKLNRSPVPFLVILFIFVVAIPLLDHVLVGFKKPLIEDTTSIPQHIYVSSIEPYTELEIAHESDGPECE